MAKELIPITFTCIVRGTRLAKHHINFQCNNANLVIAIKKGLKQGQVCNAPTPLLNIFVAHFDIYITASHLPGVINVTADHLSRGNMHQAFEVAPTLTQHPTVIPPSAFRLISPYTLDWKPPGFLQLFQQTLSCIY